MATNVNYRALTTDDTRIQLNPTDKTTHIHMPGDANDETASQWRPADDELVVHHFPERTGKRWDHVIDLDTFFSNVYNYSQKQGFYNISLAEIGNLCVFCYLIIFLALVTRCVEYDILFGHTQVFDPINQTLITEATIWSAVVPPNKCLRRFSSIEILIYTIFALHVCHRIIRLALRLPEFGDIRRFYNTILNIDDKDLSDTTWHEVLKRVREAQLEHQMVIDKNNITELDIYHRILRRQNFLVALAHKQLLPVSFHLPIVGNCVWFTEMQLQVVEWLLFSLPGAPFRYKTKPETSRFITPEEMARRFRNMIFGMSLFCLILSPILVIYNFLYIAAKYGDAFKGNMQRMTRRSWSLLGRLQLQHFNELEHELDARLNRASPHADNYCNSFSSPLLTTVAKICRVLAGAPLAYFILLTIFRERVIEVIGILPIITISGTVMLVCSFLIPNDKGIHSPKDEMTAITAHLHYLPNEWRELAHTTKIRKEFSNLYESYLLKELKELFGPIVTPFILVFVMAPRSRDIVRFFTSFTITVRGAGPVCSFAEMNVHKHGNPEWQVKTSETVTAVTKVKEDMTDGKTELSLIHFALNNPQWKMPEYASDFIKTVRDQATKELVAAKTAPNISEVDNPVMRSLVAFDGVEKEYNGIADSVLQQPITPEQAQASFGGCTPVNRSMAASYIANSMSASSRNKKGLSKVEGSIDGPNETLLSRLGDPETFGLRDPLNLTVADMNFSALYLHELREQNMGKEHNDAAKQLKQTSSTSLVTPAARPRIMIINPRKAEKTPLLNMT